MKQQIKDNEPVHACVVITSGVRMSPKMWEEVRALVRTALNNGPKDLSTACKVDTCLSITEDKDR